MSQSNAQNYLHLVFHTKNTTPLITPEIENSLYEYLGGICKKLNSPSIAIGGHINRVHILFKLSKNISLSQCVQKIKSNSSKWVKIMYPSSQNFYWQDGYGGFSIGQSQVSNYINNQHIHHQKISFKDEYIALLKEYDVDYNEDYLW